jgi:hypothetical protein
MNIFRLKFEKKYVILSYVALGICVALFIFNAWRCISGGGFTDFYSSVTYILTGAVCIFAPILLLTVIYDSKYIVKDGEFITKFGFIQSKYSIAKMTEAVYDAEKQRLAIYTGEEFMVFRVDNAWRKEFIDLLRKENRSLIYNETDNETIKPKGDNDKKENK